MQILLTHIPVMREQYYGEQALAALRALAIVKLHTGTTPLDAESLIAAAQGVGLIIADRLTPGPGVIFERLPNLRAMLRCAVDIRNIDVEAAARAGVLITRAKPGFVESVTELALGFMVDLSRNVSTSAATYRAGRTPTFRMGRQLAGSTVGIIGYGSIGRHLAPVAHALGMKVLITDPHISLDDARFTQVSFHELLSTADYVVCLAVATEETENLINAAALARMKPGAFFVNLSRGNLVDEAALRSALQDGHIAGAALDVGRAPDQMPTVDLASLPNVIATPHIGGLTPQAVAAQAFDTVAQVRALIAGDIPEGAVNVESWTRRI